MNSLDALESQLGYRFVRRELLVEAMTHSTWANENRGTSRDYERLEFLGDSVLSLVVSHLLIENYPQDREGALSRRRAQLVREPALASWARGLGLEVFVRVGQGQREAGLADSIMADVLEALMAAVYLDSDLVGVRSIFATHLRAHLARHSGDQAPQDDKTRLQELCHRLRLPQPVYEVVEAAGPSHDRTFRVHLRIGSEQRHEATGKSKKAAEQRCASAAFAALSADTGDAYRPPEA